MEVAGAGWHRRGGGDTHTLMSPCRPPFRRGFWRWSGQLRVRQALPICWLGALGLGCRDQATQACHAELSRAQVVVKEVDAKARDSVEGAAKAVDAALASCKAASRGEEVEQLKRAKAELSAHLEVLASKKARGPRAPAADEQELLKRGDPNCPRGMVYKAEGSDKPIKCTGAQPVRMSWAVAEAHYKGRGYKLTKTEQPPSLRAEYGADLVVFSYASVSDANPPQCVTLYPVPTMPWQEAVARATGAQLPKIQEGKPVPLPDGGTVALALVKEEQKLIIRLGRCEG